MKRTLSLLLVLALCLAFVSAPAHAAAANPFDKQDNKLVSYSGGLYFGYTASETLNSTYKPHITVQTREYDAVPSGEIAVNITLSGDDLSNHWSASGLHIGYDTRLTLTNKTSGDAVSNLSVQSGNTSVSGVIFAATAGSSDKGRTGVMYTLHFTLPANAKAGDVYPIGIYYDGTDSGRKDLFTNVNQDEVGKQMQSYLFYTGITNGGIKIKSNNPPVILAQPLNQTVTEGSSAHATFTFMLENSTGCTYQWEYRKNSSDTWKTEQESTIYSDSGCGCYAGGWGSSTFSLQPISLAMNGWQFRCKVTNSGGSVYTNVATLTVTSNPPPVISAQPLDQIVTEGNSAHAYFTFMLENSSGCTYQWEYRKNSSDTWKTEHESTIFSDSGCGCYAGGWGSSTFSLQPISRAMNGWQFRCKVTNSYGSVYTNVATLTVNAAPITSVAATITAPAAGASASYIPAVPSGANYSYESGHNNDYFKNGVMWRDVTAGQDMAVSSASFVAGHEYRVRIYLIPNSGYEFSEDATATVNGKTAVTRLPSDDEENWIRLDYTFPALPAQTYTVTLNPNGGTCSTPSVTVTYGQAYGTLPTPTRTGYTFKGWWTTKETGGKQVTSTTVCYASGNYTLYARWEAKKYTVTLNPNGGSVSPTSISVTYDKAYGTLPTPTRSGYTFAGWWTAKDSGGKQVYSTTVCKATGNYTLYARWTASKTYTVTLNPNGGTCSKSSITVTYGQAYGTLPTPTRTGYTFKGWWTAKDSGGKQVTSTTVCYASGNYTLYARWTAKTFTVTLNANGGTCSKSSITVTYDKAYGTLPTPTRTGYTFKGWWTTKETGGKQVTATTVCHATGNFTLYARWTAKTYTVTLNANGGTCSKSSITVTYDKAYGTLPTPTRSGYTFKGWWTTKDNTGKEVTATTVCKATGNFTMYAHWE